MGHKVNKLIKVEDAEMGVGAKSMKQSERIKIYENKI